MGIFVQHPTDQQVWDSKVGSRAAYTRAYQAQERQKKIQDRIDANTSQSPERSGSRFNPPDDPRIVAEHLRLRASHQIAVGGVMQPVAPTNKLTTLSPADERKAAEAWWWMTYPHHPSQYRESGLLMFAKAFHLLPGAAVFQGDNDPIRLLTISWVNTEEARKRFEGRY
jgi:hypothetical protein